MAKRIDKKPKGILNPGRGEHSFHLARYEPTAALAHTVEHYWSVHWDLRGQNPYRSETLPYPSMHVTVEPQTASLVGIVTHKFSRLLEGEGWVFGIKFRPGAFYPFVQKPLSTYTDKVVPLDMTFGKAGNDYATQIRAATNEDEWVQLAEHLLLGLSPSEDTNCELANLIVETINRERAITKVDQVAERFRVNKRGLQRLFSQYVGVSPKWVIQRYRLHEATELAAAGEMVDWAKLAVELGYYDQAHLIKDFKAMVGLTPADYAKQQGMV